MRFFIILVFFILAHSSLLFGIDLKQERVCTVKKDSTAPQLSHPSIIKTGYYARVDKKEETISLSDILNDKPIYFTPKKNSPLSGEYFWRYEFGGKKVHEAENLQIWQGPASGGDVLFVFSRRKKSLLVSIQRVSNLEVQLTLECTIVEPE
jgi:hypothetical protein